MDLRVMGTFYTENLYIFDVASAHQEPSEFENLSSAYSFSNDRFFTEIGVAKYFGHHDRCKKS